ncbi:hypothetical protein CAEBREN_14925 [Caenorhabditis brenneri]|uniref:Uncharacterized protein n=1 Tax=Caenorhabditis brenneri TaxID=135651 RepID=G0NDK5_CAEBE|nr:hypothetical protein CAEBREN_14925 [Caenorhabditis brenneri]
MPPKIILKSEQLEDCIKSMTNTEKVLWYAEAVLAQRKQQWVRKLKIINNEMKFEYFQRKESISASTPPTPSRPRLIRKVIISRPDQRQRSEPYFPTPSIESLTRPYQAITPVPYSPLNSPRGEFRVVKSASSSPGVINPLRHLQMLKKISQSGDSQEENEAGKERDADITVLSRFRGLT